MVKKGDFVMDVNKVILLGRLVKDPVAKSLPSGQEISLYTVATNYQWKDLKTKERKELVEFHPVIAWGNLAKISNKYLAKGAQVYIEGRLKTSSWEDKDKKKHYKTEIMAKELNLLGPKKKSAKPDELTAEDVSVEEVPLEN
ncbi:MAG: hypothetical protein A2927_00480 [Candidatus Komeilibacteria bacterium RIFCSPLOWO2_01_FULL_45_10]|uniref:Single-stranded DNA-binding protein n=1 Tax=Candidatus Komeilibacteria bacterium RIFCSPLOWO2_01_FULL_45_10 TaxID=1798550 RepID=A0A1G2BJA4_9BACT|nr:MAG: hypothetical protein A2927_00480 [Candidatus Komeilibacteria bacterium RIFCSPLOWO2_01_FULL_45_10]